MTIALGENNWFDSRFLIRNPKDQNEVMQHFKELQIKNPNPVKITFRNTREIKAFYDQRKLKNLSLQTYPKRMAKGSFPKQKRDEKIMKFGT